MQSQATIVYCHIRLYYFVLASGLCFAGSRTRENLYHIKEDFSEMMA
jgi:hypothetical protein